MFKLIFGLLVDYLLVHELVYLGLEEESDVDQFLSHPTKVGAAAFFLELLKFIKISS